MSLTPAWSEAIAGYLRSQRAAGFPETTIDCRRQHLENLGRNIGTATPWELTGTELVDWVGTRTWARETRRGRRQTFLGFYRWGIDQGHTRTNPAAALPRVKASLPDPRPIPEDVYEVALAAARDRDRLILRLAAECGLRRGEIAQIHTRDVIEDLVGYSLIVHGKGEKPRLVPLPTNLAIDLKRREAGYVFPGKINGHLSARRVGELATDVLPDEWTIHKLRHRAGTRWRNLGADILDVQELLGHASVETTRRYVKNTPDRLRRIVTEAAT